MKIITDCLQVNTDLYNEYTNSKYPKPIAKIIYYMKKRKLVNIVNKVAKGNIPLTVDDLLDLFFHTSSNYLPFGRFGAIDKSYILETQTEKFLKANISIGINDKKYDAVHADFSFNLTYNKIKEFTLELVAYQFNGETLHTTITLDKLLYKKNKEIESIVRELNTAMYYEIYSYIIHTIDTK